MRAIMGRLGHSQIGLTMNTYAHLSPELERDAADALDRVLGEQTGELRPGEGQNEGTAV
jgi:integrase